MEMDWNLERAATFFKVCSAGFFKIVCDLSRSQTMNLPLGSEKTVNLKAKVFIKENGHSYFSV